MKSPEFPSPDQGPQEPVEITIQSFQDLHTLNETILESEVLTRLTIGGTTYEKEMPIQMLSEKYPSPGHRITFEETVDPNGEVVGRKGIFKLGKFIHENGSAYIISSEFTSEILNNFLELYQNGKLITPPKAVANPEGAAAAKYREMILEKLTDATIDRFMFEQELLIDESAPNLTLETSRHIPEHVSLKPLFEEHNIPYPDIVS